MGHISSRFFPNELTERYEVQTEIGIHAAEGRETYIVEERETGRICVLRIHRKLPRNPREKRHLQESYIRLRRVRRRCHESCCR